MKITREWLMENTKYGSPTWAQFRVLGVKCPPESGWIDELVGKEISSEVANAYVAAQNVRAKKNKSLPAPPQQQKENWKFCPHCGKPLER